MGDPQPLYFYPKPNDEFVEITDATGHFYIEKHEKILIFCEHGFNQYAGTEVVATCRKDNLFMVKNRKVALGSINCKKRMLGSTRRVVNAKSCLKGLGEMAEIGFDVNQNWKPLFQICHNPLRASSEWAHHIIDPMNRGFQTKFSRNDVKFLKGNSGFYADIKTDINLLYTKKKQQETFGKILPGGKASAERLISLETSQYLSRGHLTAKADHIFGAHQLITFFFINVAPQWQSFNEGNWKFIEDNLKRFIKRIDRRAEVYTGTHGVMKYEGVELFLYIDKFNDIYKIPVPRIFYKIVVVPSLNEGIVIIGINYPFVTNADLDGEYNYCKDISRDVDIPRSPNQYHRPSGYMIACKVQDFMTNKRMIDEAPFIKNYHDLRILGRK